ncbi:MAG TPA: HAD-IIB family hydrolase [Vicinamibacterales bacterium]|nr:HAD-IIB family hydrolase [Vicinamibacterales bacterium]
MSAAPSYVVFTDVDGCLLDHSTYSFQEAMGALARLRARGVPLVLCSSKTRAEIEWLQQELGTAHPFISENGGALFVPERYFPFPLPGAKQIAGYDVIELGRPYAEVVDILHRAARKAGVTVVGFSDMTVAEVAGDCGLPLTAARLAKLREYDEPFRILEGEPAQRARLFRSLASAGLRSSAGGRYHHASGDTDKGVAVDLLRRFFRWAHGDIVAIGLGDGPNDVPFLRRVDIPIVVANPNSGATEKVAQLVPSARVTTAAGPAGWHEAMAGIMGNGHADETQRPG